MPLKPSQTTKETYPLDRSNLQANLPIHCTSDTDDGTGDAEDGTGDARDDTRNHDIDGDVNPRQPKPLSKYCYAGGVQSTVIW
ncbi:hypothetical protein BC938DRAFT_470738 [Jimgerdemannia flammicorona]|uniref:Uncharacterized protein n=1 Tax=Jimgerdemannia flammicorona TaxID=994334 RepID=A0A433Q9K2_9FUNG|nr:hypothetical protein BC938DRAFT_470738 [Jimgerdemannia flammicorona]